MAQQIGLGNSYRSCFFLMCCIEKSTWYICYIRSKIERSAHDTPCCMLYCTDKQSKCSVSQSLSFSARLLEIFLWIVYQWYCTCTQFNFYPSPCYISYLTMCCFWPNKSINWMVVHRRNWTVYLPVLGLACRVKNHHTYKLCSGLLFCKPLMTANICFFLYQ